MTVINLKSERGIAPLLTMPNMKSITLLFLLITLPSFYGYGQQTHISISGTCNPEYANDGSWVYIYHEFYNDTLLKDSCLIEDGRFRLEFDILYEDYYSIVTPDAKVSSPYYSLVLAPGDRLQINLPAEKEVRMNAIAVSGSYASRAYYKYWEERDSLSRIYNQLLDSLNVYSSDKIRRQEYEQHIAEWKQYYFGDAPFMKLLSDSQFNQSPYMCYSGLSGVKTHLKPAAFKKLLDEQKLRFPDYPPIHNMENPSPKESEQSKKDRAYRDYLLQKRKNMNR